MKIKRVGMVMLAVWTSISAAWAEVLVILPQSGQMARAGNSVKAGLEAAHQHDADQIGLRFVDSHTHSIAELLEQVNATTRLVIGPLERGQVTQWLKQDLNIPLLTLNHTKEQKVKEQKDGVYQFALSKEEDAIALSRRMKADGVKRLYVMQEAQSKADTQAMLAFVKQHWPSAFEVIQQLPEAFGPHDAIFYLGTQAWLNEHVQILQETHPKRNAGLYASAFSIDEIDQFPMGVTLCDAPSLYTSHWKEVHQLKQHESHAAYLRLMAFGADAWHIARQILSDTNHLKAFSARTGQIQIAAQIIRTPKCMLRKTQGWMEYP